MDRSTRWRIVAVASLVQLSFLNPSLLFADANSSAEAQGYKLGYGCGVVLGIIIILWLVRALFRFVVGMFRR